MRFVIFCHSLVSDWNHGNAHFLRGIVRELGKAGHEVSVHEPADGWSRANLVSEHGEAALQAFSEAFPDLSSRTYRLQTLDLDAVLDGADVVLVHEWNAPELVSRIGRHRARGGRYLLFFHDTHHRAATRPEEMAAYDLDAYDGVLAFGETVRAIYQRRGWAKRVWTWHEAADTDLFRPPTLPVARHGDLVWIGNWGDDERTAELKEYLVGPVARLRLKAVVHGVRYPPEGLDALADAGIRFAGWLPNHRVPETFARYRVTAHVPRRPYAEALPGIPTIRVFEALACGVPLISAPWDDSEGLFQPGRDYLTARSGAEMERHLRAVLSDPALAAGLARSGLETVRARHTCAHRVRELLAICAQLRGENSPTNAVEESAA